LQKARHVLQCSISETRRAFNDIARKVVRKFCAVFGTVPVDHRGVCGFLLISGSANCRLEPTMQRTGRVCEIVENELSSNGPTLPAPGGRRLSDTNTKPFVLEARPLVTNSFRNCAFGASLHACQTDKSLVASDVNSPESADAVLDE
jgi:hypothetical protein